MRYHAAMTKTGYRKYQIPPDSARCNVCETVKPLSEFSSHRGRYGPYRCVPCNTNLQQQWREKHPGYYRDRNRVHNLRKNYGITPEEYDRLAAAQNGLCAICQRPERSMRAGSLKNLAIDHDHASGQIRALLCHGCNTALGLFEERIDLLQAAIVYLGHSGAP